jgi:4-hydroxy-tetrahydrodipicolinate synthase
MSGSENMGGSAFSGTATPLVLPLLPNQTPDFESLEQLLEFQIEGGVDSLWLNGTSGEFYGLRDEERIDVIRAAKRCINGRAKIIAHVGQPTTRLVIEHAEAILELGIDALALVPPYYIPQSQAELIEHFRAISQEFNQALFLYHVPTMCKKSLSYENIVKLAAEGVLIGLKDSAGDLEPFGELLKRIRSLNLDFCCLNGNSPVLGRGYLIGADGFAGAIANIVPSKCKAAYDAARRGQQEKVNSIQMFIDNVFRVFKNCPEKPSFTWLNKWVLREFGVIRHDATFQPCDRLDDKGQQYLRMKLMPLLQGVTSAIEIPA